MKKLVLITAVMAMAVAAASAATVDHTVGGSGYPAHLDSQCYTIGAKTLDLSSTSVASNDVVQMIKIPANAIVLAVQYKVTTSTASTTTFDVGDGAAANGFASNVSSTNTAGWVSSGLSATSAGKLYTSADTLDLHFDGAPGATGKIDVTAVFIRAVRE